MLQTLSDVLRNREKIVHRISTQSKQADSDLRDKIEMDTVIVIDDLSAKRYLEFNYLHDTHFVPDALPGIGLSTGDIITNKGKTYLTVSHKVMQANVMAMHMIRRYEGLYSQWQKEYETVNNQAIELVQQIGSIDPNYFGLEVLQKFNGITSYVGWDSLRLPSIEFLEALRTAGEQLTKKRSKKAKALAQRLGKYIDTVNPYTVLQPYLQKIRDVTGHKGVPFIIDDMICFDTPAASGGATLHTNGTADNVWEALPSRSTIWLVATQAGRFSNIIHMGAGSIPGEHYTMLIPKTPFFDDVQEKIDTDQELIKLWKSINKSKSHGKIMSRRIGKWIDATRAIKESVVKVCVPKLISNRVLGFHIDYNRSHNTAYISPVIADCHYQQQKDNPALNGMKIEQKSFTDVLLEFKNGYGKTESVFPDIEQAVPQQGNNRKVLIIEDNQEYQNFFVRNLRRYSITVLAATTIEAGKNLFIEHPDLDLIVMDACVPGDTPNTLPLVNEMRATYKGLIIAASGSDDYRKQLINAGCNLQCDKADVPKTIIKLLNL